MHPDRESKQDGIVKPQIIAFEVTQRCPLNCRHCRAAACHEGTDPLSTEQCKSILKGIADYTKCVVILTGGEPMQREDIYELASYGCGVGLRMVMATCGSDLDQAAAQRLKEAGVMAFSFSLDGQDAATHDAFRNTPGAFDAVMRAIEAVKSVGLRFQINTTITRTNIDQAGAIAELATNLGAYCFNPFILVPVGRGEQIADLILDADQYEQLLKDMARLKQTTPIEVRLTCGPQFARVVRQEKIDGADKVTGCLAATGFAFVGHGGNVQTCGFLEISAGNLVEYGYDFGRLWETSELLNQLRDHGRYQGMCGSCGYLEYCRGCRARAYTMEGDVLAEDPICRLVRRSREGRS